MFFSSKMCGSLANAVTHPRATPFFFLLFPVQAYGVSTLKRKKERERGREGGREGERETWKFLVIHSRLAFPIGPFCWDHVTLIAGKFWEEIPPLFLFLFFNLCLFFLSSHFTVPVFFRFSRYLQLASFLLLFFICKCFSFLLSLLYFFLTI